MTDRLAEIRARLEAEGGSEELDVAISRWMGIDPPVPLWYTMEWTRNPDAMLKFIAYLLGEVERLQIDNAALLMARLREPTEKEMDWAREKMRDRKT